MGCTADGDLVLPAQARLSGRNISDMASTIALITTTPAITPAVEYSEAAARVR
jgi:hypothetical protein